VAVGAGAGTAGRGQAQPFQSLELLADQAELARQDDGSGSASESAGQLVLPAGFSPDTSAESVTSIGSSQASAGFFGPNGPGDFGDRFGNAFAGGDGAIAGAAGPQGPGGGQRRAGRSGRVRRRTQADSAGRSVAVAVAATRSGAASTRAWIVGARHGALRAECSADRQTRLLSAATRGDARWPARDSAHRQQPADVFLPQLHRESLAQSVRHLFHRADAGRARR